MSRQPASIYWDYLAFAIYIIYAIECHIRPAIFQFTSQGRKTEYILPKAGVPIMVVVLSVARVTLGVRSVLGYSGELFYRGSGMWETIYGMVTAILLVSVIFLPVYFGLKILTVYEYLDLRFKSKLVRCLASSTYIARQLCNFGITIYTPCIALSAVTGIHYWTSIVFTTSICVILSLIEGVRANTQAEVVQATLIILFTVSVVLIGTIDCGGPAEVYNTNLKHRKQITTNGAIRLNACSQWQDHCFDHGKILNAQGLDDINPNYTTPKYYTEMQPLLHLPNERLYFLKSKGDVSIRVETFSAWLGQLFISLSQYGCQQNLLSRYIRLRTIEEAKRAMIFMIPIIVTFFCMSWIMGVVCFATYAECDPLRMEYIEKVDQILPFFVADRMHFIPGFVGLFLALLFNGAVIVSAVGLDPLATIIWVDFLSSIPHLKRLTSFQQTMVIKSVVILLGIAVMFIAYSISLTAGVIEATLLAFAATTGALLGVFLMAMLIPMANWKGATAGMIASILSILTITFGRFILEKDATMLPTSTAGCKNFTFTHQFTSIRSASPRHHTTIELMVAGFVHWFVELLREFTHISFMYYSFIGTVITLIVGVAVSNQTQNYMRDQYGYNLLHPAVFKLSEYVYGSRPKPYYIDEPMRDATVTQIEEVTDLDPYQFGDLRRETSVTEADAVRIRHENRLSEPHFLERSGREEDTTTDDNNERAEGQANNL